MRSISVLCAILGLVSVHGNGDLAARFRANTERFKRNVRAKTADAESAPARTSSSLRVAGGDAPCGGSSSCYADGDGWRSDSGYVSMAAFTKDGCEGPAEETIFHIGKCSGGMIIDSAFWNSEGILTSGSVTLYGDGDDMCTGTPVGTGDRDADGGQCAGSEEDGYDIITYYPTWDSYVSTRPEGTLVKVFPGWWSCRFGGNMGWGHWHAMYEPAGGCYLTEDDTGNPIFRLNNGCLSGWRSRTYFHFDYASEDDCKSGLNPLPLANDGITTMPFCTWGDSMFFYTVCLSGSMP